MLYVCPSPPPSLLSAVAVFNTLGDSVVAGRLALSALCVLLTAVSVCMSLAAAAVLCAGFGSLGVWPVKIDVDDSGAQANSRTRERVACTSSAAAATALPSRAGLPHLTTSSNRSNFVGAPAS